MRRVLWAVALLAMAGSCFSLCLLWLVVSLTGALKSQARVGSKDKGSPLSDGDVSSEDGASDVATGRPTRLCTHCWVSFCIRKAFKAFA